MSANSENPSEARLAPRAEGIVRRPGGRSARVVEHVLHATSEELIEHGYEALAIERVAERAGVNKTTIYRRWPTKRDLVESLINALRGEPPQTPNTGHIATDLVMLAQVTRNRCIEYQERGLARVLSPLEHPELANLGASLRAQLREPWMQALRAGIERGELRPEIDASLVVEVIVATIVRRVSRGELPPDDDFLEALVKLVLDGVRSQSAER